jgi:hypothetical protein
MAACLGNGDDNGSSSAPAVIDSGALGPDTSASDGAASETGTPGVGMDATVQPDAGPAGGDAASPVEASADAARDAGREAGPPDASGPAYALFVGTDFTNAELAVVALHPDSLAGRLPLSDQDSVPYASGGYGFVMEHALGQVIVLEQAQPWMAKTTIDINDAPDAATYVSNPRAVLVTTESKAYVGRYASNVVQIVDVASGAVTGHLDLSAYLAPDDPDGLVDVQDAAYDPATKRAYFLLQRINQFDYGPGPDYVGACLSSHAQIVGVDVTSDSFVDLNGAAAGTAIDLLGENPPSLIADFANGRLIVPETGCYQPAVPDAGSDGGALPRLDRGIESVALSTGTSTWLYQTTNLDRLSGLVWVDGTHAFVNEGSTWFAWNPAHANLGDPVANFPRAPVSDGTGRIVGLASGTGSDGGVVYSVVAFDVGTSQLTTLAEGPFQSVVPDPTYGLSSAFLP